MSSFSDYLVAHLIEQEVALFAAAERLRAASDSEALHDLRIAVRRLRSLLHPAWGMPGIDEVERALNEVGRLSGPLRDLEVLLPVLESEGFAAAVALRRPALISGYVALLASPQWTRLLMLLDGWPRLWRTAERHGVLDGLHRQVRKRLDKQWRRLRLALRDPAHDRHRLRLLIKRVRYSLEAYPDDSPLPQRLLAPLKDAQATLGEWHDYEQWLIRSERELDLMPLQPHWNARHDLAQADADRSLERLSKALG
ncbi:CHAD domain-containing protein [Pseudomonas panipatensis]|uniref:CHAD domain-containing protein n=1 Tax=Pseudomonas panipatensis TaxID=428992 RepID=A0A1G8CLD0_9PSED|nr:CHAD domain-containing protein [Pseudomonas panipatensis]SDH46258.1 CHAD domain-containing protein [Pseudomonas panipatensis]SMP64363.1 CHAD domain-containing protein [Pseudomonas panipatensis]